MPGTSSSRSASKPRYRLIKRLSLAAASLVISLVLVVVGCRIWAAGLGIEDREFRYEYLAGMWRPDDRLGYANRGDVEAFCWGSVRLATDEHGFRGEEPVSPMKAAGVTRILGAGDSVAWGTGVNSEDSYLGVLRANLARDSRPYEVINAGVVGYSTLQELWQLEQLIPQLRPDVVLINLCYNDLLPSNDPFGLIRGAYDRHLTALIEDHRSGLTQSQRHGAHRIRAIFRDGGALNRITTPDLLPLSILLLVERPLDRMVELCRRHRCRLVFLLIPSREPRPDYDLLARVVRERVDAPGAETLDLAGLLAGDPPPPESPEDDWIRRLSRSLPLRDLDNILLHRHFEELHATRHYLDFTHPTRKGNRIIAESIQQALFRAD